MGKIIKISDEEIKKIIDFYNNSVYSVEERATTNQEGRAYRGVLEQKKGELLQIN